MKKTNIRIKDITLADQINAIERIVSSYFVDGEYTPYYADQALIVAIVDNFIDGVEFEDDEDLYELSRTDEDIASIVLKFLTPKKEESEEPDYFGITSYVMDCVRDKVDFMKQSIIHNTGKMQKITEFCDVMIDAFSNLANMVTNKLTPEQMKDATTVMKKLAESDMTKDDIVDIMKESAGFDMDKASEEIINAKNEQIKEKDKRIHELANQVTDLRKYKEQNEAKNVLANK